MLLWIGISFFSTSSFAQVSNNSSEKSSLQPFSGHFFCKETGVNMYLNLYEETIEIPKLSFLGKMYGYMQDGIYGTWMIVKKEIKDNQAIIRFSNDIGSDSQDIVFTQINDSVFHYRTKGGNAIRRAEGKKLVKVTDEMTFIKK